MSIGDPARAEERPDDLNGYHVMRMRHSSRRKRRYCELVFGAHTPALSGTLEFRRGTGTPQAFYAMWCIVALSISRPHIIRMGLYYTGIGWHSAFSSRGRRSDTPYAHLHGLWLEDHNRNGHIAFVLSPVLQACWVMLMRLGAPSESSLLA